MRTGCSVTVIATTTTSLVRRYFRLDRTIPHRTSLSDRCVGLAFKPLPGSLVEGTTKRNFGANSPLGQPFPPPFDTATPQYAPLRRNIRN